MTKYRKKSSVVIIEAKHGLLQTILPMKQTLWCDKSMAFDKITPLRCSKDNQTSCTFHIMVCGQNNPEEIVDVVVARMVGYILLNKQEPLGTVL